MTTTSRRTVLQRAGLASLAGLAAATPAWQASAAPGTPAAPVHNVLDHGAAGDGKTDDTAAFQEAIDAIAEAGQGTLLVPPGSYNLASEAAGTCVLLRADNMTVQAHGATFLRPDEFQRGMFIVNTRLDEPLGYGAGIRNLRWLGGRFLGNIAEKNYICPFGLHNVQNCHFEGITFENCQAGASHIFDMVGADNVTIKECRFLGVETRGETANVAEAVQIGASYKGGLTGGHTNVGFSGLMTRDVTIQDCEFLPWAGQAGPTPFGHHGGVEGKHHHRLRFLHNTVQDPRTSLVDLDDPDAPAIHGVVHLSGATDVEIVGNVFRQTQGRVSRVITLSGFKWGVLEGADPDKPSRGDFPPQGPARILIRDNEISGFGAQTGQEAICVDALDGAMASDVTISRNVITNGEPSTDPVPALRLANLAGPVVSANKIKNHRVGIGLLDGVITDGEITRNTITNATGTQFDAAITVHSGVTDTDITRNVTGGYAEAVSGEPGEGTVISGNTERR